MNLLSLRSVIFNAISGWFAKRPELQKSLTDEALGWLAKQPGASDMELHLRCPECSNEWTARLDYTKPDIFDLVKATVRCPVCGSESARVQR